MPKLAKPIRFSAPRVPSAFIEGAAACRLPGAIEFTGMGRTTLLAHVKAGRLRAKKDGRALLFEISALRALVKSLPDVGRLDRTGSRS